MVTLFTLLACGSPSPTLPEIVCTDRAELHDVSPLRGGRARWCERKNGTRHGPFTELRENGTLFKTGQYHNNRKTGAWTLYHPSGRRMEEATYEAGELSGWRVRYDEAGTPLDRTFFVEGRSTEPPEASPP